MVLLTTGALSHTQRTALPSFDLAAHPALSGDPRDMVITKDNVGMFVCVSVCICTMGAQVCRSQEGTGSPGTDITEGCGHNVDAGNQISGLLQC